MRFDDSLKTVLAADVSTAFGARAAFRQLVDLLARRRVPLSEDLAARLVALRRSVPVEVRIGTARGLALADAPADLVALFATDDPDVAAAVLRAARLDPEEWETVLPRLGPHGRSVLRRRDDLPPSVVRALQSFGSTDFALGHDGAAPVATPAQKPLDLTVMAAATPVAPAGGERFEIADLVNRIEAFQRDRSAAAPAAMARETPAIAAFRFETDAAGAIRWVDAAPRGAIVGVTLRHTADDIAPSVDGVAAGAFRKRAAFADARLVVGGESLLAGDWRISGVPVFDQATGSFVGFRGRARRPRVEEDAARLTATRIRPVRNPTGADGLRRLVHELRTPTNAIAGFSELIEQELLGPVAPVYRDRAATIRRHVTGLIGAIEDVDLAARIEGDALDLRADIVAVMPLLSRVAHDLAPLAGLRGGALALPSGSDAAWSVDSHAAERLVSRLLATLLGAARAGELLHVALEASNDTLALVVDRPAALGGRDEAALLTLDDEAASDDEGAPLLGAGFALRLARNLAIELGGRLVFAADRLTLTLPAALNGDMEQAQTFAP